MRFVNVSLVLALTVIFAPIEARADIRKFCDGMRESLKPLFEVQAEQFKLHAKQQKRRFEYYKACDKIEAELGENRLVEKYYKEAWRKCDVIYKEAKSEDAKERWEWEDEHPKTKRMLGDIAEELQKIAVIYGGFCKKY